MARLGESTETNQRERPFVVIGVTGEDILAQRAGQAGLDGVVMQVPKGDEQLIWRADGPVPVAPGPRTSRDEAKGLEPPVGAHLHTLDNPSRRVRAGSNDEMHVIGHQNEAENVDSQPLPLLFHCDQAHLGQFRITEMRLALTGRPS